MHRERLPLRPRRGRFVSDPTGAHRQCPAFHRAPGVDRRPENISKCRRERAVSVPCLSEFVCAELNRHLTDFVAAYNFACRLKSLRGLTLGAICKPGLMSATLHHKPAASDAEIKHLRAKPMHRSAAPVTWPSAFSRVLIPEGNASFLIPQAGMVPQIQSAFTRSG